MVKGYDLFVPINYGLHHTYDKWVLLFEEYPKHWTLDDFLTAFMQQVSKHGDLFHFNFHGSKKVIKPLQGNVIEICTLWRFKPK